MELDMTSIIKTAIICITIAFALWLAFMSAKKDKGDKT